MESRRNFEARVLKLTRCSLGSIPAGTVDDLRGRRAIFHQGRTIVIRVKDPVSERESDGDSGHSFETIDYAHHFRVVTLDQ